MTEANTPPEPGPLRVMRPEEMVADDEAKRQEFTGKQLIQQAELYMERSLSQAKLFGALAEFQGIVRKVEADSDNPHFGSKYASLAAMWSAIQEPLASCKLCLIQEPQVSDAGVLLRSTLAHASGEWRSSLFFLPVTEKNLKNAQAFGSALSYAKRYAGGSILGVATSAEDDDGTGGERSIGTAVSTETAAFKGWMAWGKAQVMQMEKAVNQKQLDRVVLDNARKMAGQAIPDELPALFETAAAAAQDRINLAADAQRGSGDSHDPDGDIPQ